MKAYLLPNSISKCSVSLNINFLIIARIDNKLPTLTLTRGGTAEPRSLAQTLVQIIFHELNDKLGQW